MQKIFEVVTFETKHGRYLSYDGGVVCVHDSIVNAGWVQENEKSNYSELMPEIYAELENTRGCSVVNLLRSRIFRQNTILQRKEIVSANLRLVNG